MKNIITLALILITFNISAQNNFSISTDHINNHNTDEEPKEIKLLITLKDSKVFTLYNNPDVRFLITERWENFLNKQGEDVFAWRTVVENSGEICLIYVCIKNEETGRVLITFQFDNENKDFISFWGYFI